MASIVGLGVCSDTVPTSGALLHMSQVLAQGRLRKYMQAPPCAAHMLDSPVPASQRAHAPVHPCLPSIGQRLAQWVIKTYDSGASSPPVYPQAIFNQATSTQVINVTDPSGIVLCQIAASGTNAATTATFNGTTLGGSTLTSSDNLLPAYMSKFPGFIVAPARTHPDQRSRCKHR